ncbi:MAG: SDR family NAD(P)-dependent oxidoreductase [Bacteroidia bacterium]
MTRTILITGATAGIGQACARIFAQEGNCRLILTGRRTERLSALAAELPVECLALPFDVRNADAVSRAIEGLSEPWSAIDILVNNAGLAVGKGPLQEAPIDDWDRMIDTNIKGLLYMTRAVAPGMVARGKGHIINIGSVAGKEVYPGGGVYCGTKHAVDAISRGMRMDLLADGIKVSQVCPGLVDTEFSTVRFKGDKNQADSTYNGMTPLSGDDIAKVVSFVANLPAHMNIEDVVVFPTDQGAATLVKRDQ